jgi:hypothetical protein
MINLLQSLRVPALCRRAAALWASSRGRRSRRGAADRLGAELSDCHDVLMKFGRDSDLEFTALAKELGRFGGELASLRQQAGQLSAVVEDRDEDRALSAAYALYKGSVDLVHASLGIAVSEQEQMQAVEQRLLQACEARSAYDRNDMMLRLLTLNIRMEAVRLGREDQGVFLTVAANIAEIATAVMDSSNTAFDRIETIVQEAAAERAGLRRLEDTLHQRAHRSVETIFVELEKLRTALAPCGERSRAIEERLSQTAPIATAMMMALQHQDIVRQKLEHIAIGFDDIAEQLPEACRVPGAAAAFVHQAAAVQHAQLRAARGEIEQAGREVTDDMAQLLQQGEQVLDDYRALETAITTAFADCRLADLYREQITELAGIAAQGQTTNEKVAQAVVRIGDVVRLFSQTIAHQEYDVKIVSLNAQIAAARTTSAEALNKLSEECSRVSNAIAGITAGLSTQLDQVLGELQQIRAQAESFLGIVSHEKTALAKGAVDVSERLRRLGEQIRADAARTGQGFAKLFGETSTLLHGLHFPELIAASYDPAESLCQRLRQLMADSEGRELDASSAAKLAAHSERYTMEEERKAHSGALGAVTTAATAEPLTEVELFYQPSDTVPAAVAAPITAAEPALAGADPASPAAPAEAAPESGPPPAAPKPALGPGIELF